MHSFRQFPLDVGLMVFQLANFLRTEYIVCFFYKRLLYFYPRSPSYSQVKHPFICSQFGVLLEDVPEWCLLDGG